MRGALAVIAGTAAGLALLTPASAAPARPTAVGVGEREWRIALYRPTVPLGRVKFNVRNFGEDGHDLAVRTRAGRRIGSLPEIKPGLTASLVVRLRRPGRYTVYCSLTGHEELGMKAVLRVKKRHR